MNGKVIESVTCIIRKWIEEISSNPFFVYSFVWTISLLLYLLDWSGTFPSIGTLLLNFIFSTIVASFLIGLKFKNRQHKEVNVNPLILWKVSLYITIISVVIFTLTFIFKGIPIYKILFTNENFLYTEYGGIQYLTISGVALNALGLSIYTIQFKKLKQKRYLFLILLSILPVVLLFNRLTAFVTLLPLIFTIAYSFRFSKLKYFVAFICFILILSYLFGLVGDYREIAKKRDSTERFYSTYLGDKYPEFLPKEFFWSYFYITSPIGKLQYVFNDQQVVNSNPDYVGLALLEVLPNAIGYRLNDIYKRPVRVSESGYPSYFAGTTYSYVFIYGKWTGVILFLVLFFGFLFLTLAYIQTLHPIIKIVLSSVLCTFAALSVFSNMMILTVFYLIFTFGFLLSVILKHFERKYDGA